jgi:asparagine synthase (glutamine-hydrolysing)
MFVEFDGDDLRNGRRPGVRPPWLEFRVGKAEVVGERLGFPEIYLYHSADLVVLGTTASEVLTRLSELGRDTTLSSFGMSQFLHHGLIPPPHTEWEEIWFIGMGDRATLAYTSQGIDLSFDREYPFLEANSMGTSRASASELLELLTTAVDRQLVSAGNEGFLMMSSGKDSVSVAVALAEGDHSDIPCITYRSDPSNTENELASEICRKLGLKHQTLDLPLDTSVVEERLIRFFEGSPRPCGDNAQIPYALAVGDSGLASGAVFDGSGNDLYMGFVPSSKIQTKQRYRIRNDAIARGVERMIPVASAFNYLTRSRVATSLSGRAFRLPDTKRFYPEVVDTRPYWGQVSEDTAAIGDVDLETAVVSIFQDQAGVHLKAHVAAQAFGIQASLPYCDPDLVDYFFNLPVEDKYDTKSGVTKILLRRMLLDTIGYDAEAVGKHYFGFAGAQFLLDHRSFVLSEIAQCTLWSSDVVSLAGSWLDRLERRPLLYHSLLILFQLSGWHNHSRYIR